MKNLIAVALLLISPAQETDVLKVFREEFVQIPAGTFTMGSVQEQPAHKVTFARSFKIARYEVPQNLWKRVMGENPSKWKGKRNSVEMLSFQDAVDFCAKATALMREAKLIDAAQEIRLPTEAEWEYCTRAGTPTAYSFGDDVADLDAHAWHTGNAAGNDPPVGAKKPNAWGLYDTHGYLWEFCVGRAMRGGSWKDKADRLASHIRIVGPETLADDAVGLRCVLSKPLNNTLAQLETQPIAQDQIIA